MPVHSLEAAQAFYGGLLGCTPGRTLPTKWQDYSLHGHQIVCHWVGDDYKHKDYFSPVGNDEVPVPHFGLSLTVDEFHELAAKVTGSVDFILDPGLRFVGTPGEQWTMFFKDPSGNNLEVPNSEHSAHTALHTNSQSLARRLIITLQAPDRMCGVGAV